MSESYQVRSNVKVVFDSHKVMHPQARLMYKVRGFIFKKWVEVNSCNQTDHRYRQRSVDEMIKILLKDGHTGKFRKKRERRLRYQLKNM